MTEKILGKLTNVKFGSGGYDGAMFGLTVTLEMGHSSCMDFIGVWKHPNEAQRPAHADTMMSLIELMEQARVDEVHELEGIPVEVTMDGSVMKSWRVLEEVL